MKLDLFKLIDDVNDHDNVIAFIPLDSKAMFYAELKYLEKELGTDNINTTKAKGVITLTKNGIVKAIIKEY